MYCNNCGTELATDDKFCTNCGIEVKENEAVNENNLNGQAKKKKYKKIIFIAVAIILVLTCILMSGNAGKLRRAKIFASLEKYGLAYDAISKSDSPKHEIHKNYYQLMSLAENLVSEKDASLFSSDFDNMSMIINVIKGNESKLADEEKDIYDGICEAMNARTESLKAKDSIQFKLTSVLDLQEQITAFQVGEIFAPKEIEKKAISWQENVEAANSLYKEIMDDYDLPQYNDIVSELNRILSSMRDPDYYTKSDLYFTKYNTQFKSLYSNGFIEELCGTLEYNINLDCLWNFSISLYDLFDDSSDASNYKKKLYWYESPNMSVSAARTVPNSYYYDIINLNFLENKSDGVSKFYDAFEGILNFENFLSRAPYDTNSFDYYYSYNNEKDDIKGIINNYIQEMQLLGFELEGPVDENSAFEYKLNGEKYIVQIVDDYALEHIEIHIKNNK